MTHTWTHLESAYLAGGYTLQAWLGEDERGAFFRTAPGIEGTCALVKLVPEDRAGAETQLAMWRRTRRLDHPNLLPLLDCGRTDIAGEQYLYAVFEYPDDRLDTATAQRPLSEPEVRAVMAAVSEGLRYLHTQGLAPAALDAGQVVAVGDSIKLATDSLREPAGGDAGQAQDEWQLAQLAASLRSGAERTRSDSEQMPQITAEPMAKPLEPWPTTATHPRKPVPRWIYFAVSALLLLIAWLNLGRRAGPDKHPLPTPAPKIVAGPPPRPVFREPESAPAAQSRASQSKAGQSNVGQSKVTQSNVTQGKLAGAAMWRVIAYTYTSRAAAEKKVRAINAEWPDLRPHVFVPGRGNGMYLVALGGRMTRQEALNFQKLARGKGLPKDIYVQNYSE